MTLDDFNYSFTCMVVKLRKQFTIASSYQENLLYQSTMIEIQLNSKNGILLIAFGKLQDYMMEAGFIVIYVIT